MALPHPPLESAPPFESFTLQSSWHEAWRTAPGAQAGCLQQQLRSPTLPPPAITPPPPQLSKLHAVEKLLSNIAVNAPPQVSAGSRMSTAARANKLIERLRRLERASGRSLLASAEAEHDARDTAAFLASEPVTAIMKVSTLVSFILS